MASIETQGRDLLRKALLPEITEEATVGGSDSSAKGALAIRYGRGSEVDYISAYQLVQKAAETIVALHERHRLLDAELRESTERFQTELQEYQAAIKAWEHLGTELKAQLERSEANGADLRLRQATLETRIASLDMDLEASERGRSAAQALLREAEDRARIAGERAAEEIKLASSFREAISETFGSGRLSAMLAPHAEP